MQRSPPRYIIGTPLTTRDCQSSHFLRFTSCEKLAPCLFTFRQVSSHNPSHERLRHIYFDEYNIGNDCDDGFMSQGVVISRGKKKEDSEIVRRKQNVGDFMDEEDRKEWRRRRRRRRGLVEDDLEVVVREEEIRNGGVGAGWEILRNSGVKEIGEEFLDGRRRKERDLFRLGDFLAWAEKGKVGCTGLGFEGDDDVLENSRDGKAQVRGMVFQEEPGELDEDVFENVGTKSILGRRGRCHDSVGSMRDGSVNDDDDGTDPSHILHARFLKQKMEASKRAERLERKKQRRVPFANFVPAGENRDDFFVIGLHDCKEDGDLKIPMDFVKHPFHNFKEDRFKSKIAALSIVLRKEIAKVSGAERRRLLLGERALPSRNLEQLSQEREKAVAAIKSQMSSVFINEGSVVSSKDRRDEARKKRVVGDVVRETTPWLPAAILCKRLGVARPTVDRPVVVDITPPILQESQKVIDEMTLSRNRDAADVRGDIDEAVVQALPGPIDKERRPSKELYAAVFGNSTEVEEARCQNDSKTRVGVSESGEANKHHSEHPHWMLEGNLKRVKFAIPDKNDSSPTKKSKQRYSLEMKSDLLASTERRIRKRKPLASDFF